MALWMILGVAGKSTSTSHLRTLQVMPLKTASFRLGSLHLHFLIDIRPPPEMHSMLHGTLAEMQATPWLAWVAPRGRATTSDSTYLEQLCETFVCVTVNLAMCLLIGWSCMATALASIA